MSPKKHLPRTKSRKLLALRNLRAKQKIDVDEKTETNIYENPVASTSGIQRNDTTPQKVTSDFSENMQPEEYSIDKQTEMEIETESAASMDVNVLEGRRIVDIMYIFQQIQSANNHEPFDCNFSSMAFVREKQKGLASCFVFKCNMCQIEKEIFSEDSQQKLNLNVNSAAVLATISTGGGHSELVEQHSILNIPAISFHQYTKHHNIVSTTIFQAVQTTMEEAGKEELRLAKEINNVDRDGNGLIAVIADGAWSKRSYKVNYNALSGVACIVGAKTGKLLYLGSRNKYCPRCAWAAAKKVDIPEHECLKNWTGSSTSMETSIIVEGFKASVDMHKLKYVKLIGDGDSSVYDKLCIEKPYGARFPITKIECTNHLLRNYCSRLRELTKKRISSKKLIVDVSLRKLLQLNIMRLRIGIKSAVNHHRKDKKPVSQQIESLKNDINNCPRHVFGDHDNCNSYFCKGPKTGEKNVIPEMIKCGLLDDIMVCGNRLQQHVHSLLLNMNNNAAESYNSIIAKFIGGKRINFSVKNSYDTRCRAAALQYNSKEEYYKLIHKKLTGKSPGIYTKAFMAKKSVKRLRNLRRRELFPKKKSKVLSAPADTDYGIQELEPDDDIEKRKEEFLSFLSKTTEEIVELEIKTRGQSSNPTWREERSYRLTASRFGEVCKQRKTTNPKKLANNIINNQFKGTVATKWGHDHEEIAKRQFENEYNLKVKECGLFVLQEYPYLGASPDGIIDENTIIEIKCPYSSSKYTPQEAINEKKITYLEIKEGTIKLKKNSNYFYQVQGQLAITRTKYCYFLVWTPLGICVDKIERDETFWENMLPKLKSFYLKNLLPELVKK